MYIPTLRHCVLGTRHMYGASKGATYYMVLHIHRDIRRGLILAVYAMGEVLVDREEIMCNYTHRTSQFYG